MTDLREVLRDAVADVEPTDRLAEIRARASAPRRRTPYVGGAVLAAAVTVVAVVLVATHVQAPDEDPAGAPTATATPTAGRHAAALYYLGATDRGARLFREFHQVTGPTTLPVRELADQPADPDYATWWSPGSFVSAEVADGMVRVEVGGPGLRDRPAGMSAEQADLSVQQVVYTLQAAVGERLPVRFLLDGASLDLLYGVAVDEPVVQEAATDVLAQVLVSDPVEGQRVTGRFVARGAADVPEATVSWQLLDGTTVVGDGYATATGSIDRHHPWETEIDVSGLEPGRYTLTVTSPDDSGGEGFAPDVDTRTVVVE